MLIETNLVAIAKHVLAAIALGIDHRHITLLSNDLRRLIGACRPDAVPRGDEERIVECDGGFREGFIFRAVVVEVVRVLLNAFVEVIAERLFGLFAPHIVFQSGEVDKGVAVALHFVDRVVASHLDLIDRVQLRPAFQDVHLPVEDRTILCSAKHLGGIVVRPGEDAVLIARRHVEIDARDVTFYLVIGLKDGCDTGRCAKVLSGRSPFAVTRQRSLHPVFIADHLAERQVVAATVQIGVGGHHLRDVRHHGTLLVIPALRHQVLSVVAVALLLHTAAEVRARLIRCHI